jgi:hypothetical protein
VIVISAALVVVALILLVIGLVVPSLGFVYASIAVSLASFAFLIRGILSRRGELPSAVADGDVVAPVVPLADDAVVPVAPRTVKAQAAPGGAVLVVAGRPRYHVAGCRYLVGKDADTVDVNDAREDGFTACGVCRPDEALSAAVPVEAIEPVVESVPEPTAVRLVKPPAKVSPAKAPLAAKAAPVKAAPVKAAPVRVTAPVKAAPVRATAPKVTAPKAAAKPVAAKATPKPAAAKAVPAKAAPVKAAPAKAAPAKKAAAPAPVKRGGVVVIPDRGKFHTADCRYVRGAEGTLEMTRAAASKQGYVACGVCNP